MEEKNKTKYYCVRNKFNNVIGYGNTDLSVTREYKKQFHDDNNFDIIELGYFEFKRRRWLFWVIFIPLTIAAIWVWSDIITSCNYQRDMERQSKTIRIPENQV